MEDVTVYVVNYNRKFLSLQYVDPVTGKRKTKSSKTTNRRKAALAAVEWQTELRNGLYRSPSKQSWAEFKERYEREYMQARLKAGSHDSIYSTFSMVDQLMGPQRLRQITSQWVTQFQLKLADAGRQPATIAKHLRNLRTAMNWAKTQNFISEVPTIKEPKKGKHAKQMKGRPITEEEFERMLDAAWQVVSIRAPAWQRFMKGLWWSGLRLSEAIDLTWDQWADGIRVQVSADGYVFLLISPEDEKGGKDRIYPVAPEFAEMLLDVPAEERSGFVFDLPQKTGTRPGRRETGKKLSRMGEAAAIKVDESNRGEKKHVKYASAHDLRRAFGFRWSRRIFPAELMELMRHDDISTTMKFYVGQQAELTAKKLYEALAREKGLQQSSSSGVESQHNTSHNTSSTRMRSA